MRPHGKHIIALLVLVGIMQNIAAQQRPFVQYTPANGLVSNRARKIFQDTQGKLYITTFGGLSVYDGARFTNYTTDNGLVAGLVNDVVEMGEDSIWIIPNGAAIHCLVHGQLKNLQTSDDFFPVINQLLRAPEGSYYAAADEGLFRYEGRRFIKIPLPDESGRDQGHFLTQAVATTRYIFLLTDLHLDKFPGPGLLLVYDKETKQCVTLRSHPPFASITKTPDDEIWLSSVDGIERIDLEKLRTSHHLSLLPISQRLQPPGREVPTCIYFDHGNNPWFSTNTGVYAIDHSGANIRTFSAANGLPDGGNTTIFQDREGTMWFANEENGISKLADPDIQLLKEPTRGLTTYILYANPKGDSTWFLDLRNNQLLLLHNDQPTRYRCISPIASAPVSLIMTPTPYLIARHHIYQLTVLPGNRFKADCLASDTLSSYGSAAEDTHGNLAVVSAGLTTVLSGKISRYTLPGYIDQPVFDKDDNLWLATRTNKLLTAPIIATDTGFTLQPLKTIDTRTLPPISPRSLAIDRSGHVWVGTRDHGLFCLTLDQHRIAKWKQWTVRDGLSGNFITTLYCDPDNTIWVGSSTGLDQVTGDDRHLTVRNRTSGFHDYSFVLGVQSSVDDVHWAATRSGLLKITSAGQNVAGVPSPAISFSGIFSGNKPIDPRQPIDLSYKDNSLHFFLAAPSFVNETQTRFQYRLEGGANSEWSNPSARGEINFDNLLPGHYRLHVKALFFGRYADPEAKLEFRILPPWWQTTVFRIITALLAAVLILAAVRLYTRRKLEKQRTVLEKQQAVEKERTRIAMDMHDDLGAGLTRIKFITEDMAQKPGNALVRTDLEKLRASSNDLVDKMGEIIWAMNEKNNTLEDLLFYLRGYAADYCHENGLVCEFVLPTAIPERPISGQTRRNIFLILKESLHNVVKHADARKVLIEINVDNDLVLQVTDDGAGFDHQTPPSGNGLLNMEFRASALNGSLKILRRKPATILLKIPL